MTRQELLSAGVTRHEIQQRMGTGALISIHHGVFRVGHAGPPVSKQKY